MKTLVKLVIQKIIKSENDEDYQDQLDNVMLFLEENGFATKVDDEDEITDDSLLDDEDLDF